MTNNIIDLLMKVAGDIPERLHVYLQKLASEEADTQVPPNQPSVTARLPLRINLRRHMSNKLLCSAELKRSFSFTPQEIQTIETYAKEHHLSKENALTTLIKLSLQDHELLPEITWQVRQWFSHNTQVEIDIELWGAMTWDEEHTNTNTA